MDRCRWVPDKSIEGGGFNVPGCWNRALNDDADCMCPTDDELGQQNANLEREIGRLLKENDELKQRIGRLKVV